MGKQIVLEDDVMIEIINRAVELDMVFKPVNEVLRVILGLNKTRVGANSVNYPSSKDHKLQGLLDGLRDTIFGISVNGMMLHGNRKWVANPNTVTIAVQDARAHSLRITVYGNPEDFKNMGHSLRIQRDMNSYSRFVLSGENQLPDAIKVIQCSYTKKKERGRL